MRRRASCAYSLFGYCSTTVREREERTARLRRRALGEVDAEPALEEVRRALEIHEALEVPRVVDARVGRVLADEGVGRVDGGLVLAGAVIRVDEVETRLARLGREGVPRHQRFVHPDRERVVALDHRPVAALIDHLRVRHRLFQGLPRTCSP